mgnify:CR=1 FL=1
MLLYLDFTVFFKTFLASTSLQQQFKDTRKYFEENKTVDAAEASPLYVRDHVALTIEERKAEKSR